MKALTDMTLEELWTLFPIQLKPYHQDYTIWYEEEKKTLTSLLASQLIRISHIGSTNIPTIYSKPIIDILVEIRETSDLTFIIQQLQAQEWILMRQAKEPKMRLSFNKGYTVDGFAEKVFHLHIRYLNDCDELYFRDYLLLHPNIAKEYEQLKLQLKNQFEHNRDAYSDAKTEFVERYTSLAKLAFKKKYEVKKKEETDS